MKGRKRVYIRVGVHAGGRDTGGNSLRARTGRARGRERTLAS
jgi:hypothetical protein